MLQNPVLPLRSIGRRLLPVLLLGLSGCVPPVVLNYQGFHNIDFPARGRPAEIHDKPVESLLTGGYLLIGYVDLRQNIRECFDDGSCRKISDKVPTRADVQRIAAERGGDVVTLLEEKPILEKVKRSHCTSFTSYSYTVQGKTYFNTVCVSSITRHGNREAKITRALIWRYDPRRASVEANQRAIRQAMESLARTYKAGTADADKADPPGKGEWTVTGSSPPGAPAGGDRVHPMLRAMTLGRDDEVKRLAGNRDVQRWRDAKDRTLLMLAILWNQPRYVETLLAAGHDRRAQDRWGNIALSYALGRGYLDVADRLVAAGDDPRHRNYKGNTLYMHAVISDDPRALDWLSKHGVDPAVVGDQGFSPLMLSALQGKTRALGWLLARRLPVEARDHRGRTALIYAASGGHVQCIRLLLARRAMPQAADQVGNNALMYAAAFGREEAVTVLIKAGVRVNHVNRGGESALYTALYRGKTGAARLLLRHGAQANAGTKTATDLLRLAIKANDAGIARTLIHRGADVRALERKLGHSAMQLAPVGSVHPDLVRLLAGHGMDVNYRGPLGRTPLMTAAAAGRADLVRVLLELKADAARRDGSGRTALMLATVAGRQEVVGVLRDAGVKE